MDLATAINGFDKSLPDTIWSGLATVTIGSVDTIVLKSRFLVALNLLSVALWVWVALKSGVADDNALLFIVALVLLLVEIWK